MLIHSPSLNFELLLNLEHQATWAHKSQRAELFFPNGMNVNVDINNSITDCTQIYLWDSERTNGVEKYLSIQKVNKFLQWVPPYHIILDDGQLYTCLEMNKIK